jgi:uncharacterized protein (TIGR02246 family)
MSRNPMYDLLSRWKLAFDGHDNCGMAKLFTTDAVFQGFGPTVISGQGNIREYYEAVPDNRTADVKLVHVYSIGEEVAGGFADVTFSDRAGWEVAVHLSLVLQFVDGDWLIRQYHVSEVMTDH